MNNGIILPFLIPLKLSEDYPKTDAIEIMSMRPEWNCGWKGKRSFKERISRFGLNLHKMIFWVNVYVILLFQYDSYFDQMKRQEDFLYVLVTMVQRNKKCVICIALERKILMGVISFDGFSIFQEALDFTLRLILWYNVYQKDAATTKKFD